MNELEEILDSLRDYYSDEDQLEREFVLELVQIGYDPDHATSIALDLIK